MTPGYHDRALARLERLQDYWRDFCFLGVNEELRFAGGFKVEVRQLTLRMFVQLCAVRSPFLVGGKVGAEHVAQILWRLSPQYETRLSDGEARYNFTLSIAPIPYHSAVRTISRFIDRMLIDKPAVSSKRKNTGTSTSKIDTSLAASMIHTLAGAYGWETDAILDQPMPRIFQYLRTIRRENDPDAVTFNALADNYKARVLKKFLLARQEARKNANKS